MSTSIEAHVEIMTKTRVRDPLSPSTQADLRRSRLKSPPFVLAIAYATRVV